MNLREELALTGSMIARCTKVPDSWAHNSYQDLVAQNGKEFERKRLPKGFARMKPKNCYENAVLCVLKGQERYRYVEGYARGMLAMEHAWVLDAEDGKIFDPTWPFDDDHQEYLGIVFPNEFMWETVVKTGFYGLISNDWLNDNSLLKHGAALWAKEAA